jgi:UDP-N-acetylglucosamine 4,6-dehydratase/5-epimerase
MLQNSKITVFGGSGYLGMHLIKRLIDMGYEKITSVSRNENSAVILKEKFPNVEIIIGDIADPWVVKKAMADADMVMVLSALKHVGIAEKDVRSCVNTNIVGTMNIIQESSVTKPSALVFISSDKAASGNGVYGISKKIGEKLMNEAETINPETKYRSVRYGNVWASHGSIGTKWEPKMRRGEEVILTDPEASRFFWTVDEAVDLIFESIEKATDSTPYTPSMKSAKMGVVLQACMEVWGKSPVKIIGLQPGENKTETMDGKVFSDEVPQFTMEEFKHKFLMK